MLLQQKPRILQKPMLKQESCCHKMTVNSDTSTKCRHPSDRHAAHAWNQSLFNFIVYLFTVAVRITWGEK